MPIYEFDEWENGKVHPDTGEQLFNYWGYSTLGFFAPKAGWAPKAPLSIRASASVSAAVEAKPCQWH